MEKVHIMMATYNGEKYLREQLDSIIDQTYKNWVLYISDDRSTDNTVNIIQEYCLNYPDKIILLDYKIKKGGASSNFSYLFNNVDSADYYMFSDQDDKWKPNKIEKSIKTIKAMKKSGLKNNLVYCDAELVDGNMNSMGTTFIKNNNLVFKEDNRASILIYNFAAGAAMLIDNDLYEIIGKIPECSHIHDWYCMIYAIYFGNVRCIKDELYYYRQHQNNVYGARDKVTVKWLKNYFKETSILETYRRLKKQSKDLLIAQHRVIEYVYQHSKQNMSTENKNIMQTYLSLFEKKSKLKKINIIIKNKFYMNRFIDTILLMIVI